MSMQIRSERTYRRPAMVAARVQAAAPMLLAGGTVALLAASAWRTHRLAREAERRNPPLGRLLDVDGVRLHVLERGTGAPLVLLHGNGSMIQDFLSSGLLDRAAESHRVIALDRPGYGHSSRPRGRLWTPEAQAEIIAKALGRLGVEKATVFGHSWGCLVAVALARKRPDLVGRLVLASGYYFPSLRADIVPMSVPAVPVLGDIVRYSLAPYLSRLLWPRIMRKIFGPASTPEKFEQGFPREMALRPSQLRASAAESALMIPSAAAQGNYAELSMPVSIIVGWDDRLIDPRAQSARLHEEIPGSTFTGVEGSGHMVHQTATDAVMKVIGQGVPA